MKSGFVSSALPQIGRTSSGGKRGATIHLIVCKSACWSIFLEMGLVDHPSEGRCLFDLSRGPQLCISEWMVWLAQIMLAVCTGKTEYTAASKRCGQKG